MPNLKVILSIFDNSDMNFKIQTFFSETFENYYKDSGENLLKIFRTISKSFPRKIFIGCVSGPTEGTKFWGASAKRP